MSGADCRPWFVGVWDTVSSVGWIENPLKLPYIADNPSIQIGRHAIAIDERRAFFRSHLWRPSSRADQEHGPKDLSRFGFLVSTAMLVGAIWKPRAASQRSRSSGCLTKRSRRAAG